MLIFLRRARIILPGALLALALLCLAPAAQAQPPTIVGSSSNYGTSTPMSISVPSGCQAGDVLFFYVAAYGTSCTVSQPTGSGTFTTVGTTQSIRSSSYGQAVLSWTTYSSSYSSYSFTFGGTVSNVSGVCIAVRGTSTTSPVDISNTASGSTTKATTVTVSGVTTTIADDMALGFGAAYDTTAEYPKYSAMKFATAGSTTDQVDVNSSANDTLLGINGTYKQWTSSGATGNFTETISESSYWVGAVVALKPQVIGSLAATASNLSAALSATYTSAWPSTAAEPQHWWPFIQSGNYNDYGSTGGLNLTAEGSGNSFSSSGLVLNGSGYAQGVNNPDICALGATWSILIQWEVSSVPSSNGIIFLDGRDISGDQPGVMYFWWYNWTAFAAQSNTSTSSTNYTLYSGTPLSNTLYQDILTLDGSGNLTLYRNGILLATLSGVVTPGASSAPFCLGAQVGGSTLWPTIFMHVAVLKGTAWSAADVSNIYSSFTTTTITAALAGTLANVTAALVGGHGVAGTLAGGLSPATASFAANTLVATLTAAVSQVTASLSGSIVDYAAQLAGTLSQATGNLIGEHGVGASLSGVLGQATAALSGAHGAAGTIGATLSQVTASLSAGIVDYAAQISGVVGQVTASLTEGHGVGAALSGVFSQVTAYLTGNHGVAGSLSGTLSPIADSLTGNHGVGAVLSGTVAQVSAALNGTISTLQSITMALAGSLGQITGNLRANHGVAANIAGALSQVTASVAGNIVSFVAQINAVLSPPTASLQGAHGVSAFMAGVLSPVTAALASGHGIAARISGTLSPVIASLTGAVQRLYTYIIRLLVPPENRTLPLPAENRVWRSP